MNEESGSCDRERRSGLCVVCVETEMSGLRRRDEGMK